MFVHLVHFLPISSYFVQHVHDLLSMFMSCPTCTSIFELSGGLQHSTIIFLCFLSIDPSMPCPLQHSLREIFPRKPPRGWSTHSWILLWKAYPNISVKYILVCVQNELNACRIVMKKSPKPKKGAKTKKKPEDCFSYLHRPSSSFPLIKPTNIRVSQVQRMYLEEPHRSNGYISKNHIGPTAISRGGT